MVPFRSVTPSSRGPGRRRCPVHGLRLTNVALHRHSDAISSHVTDVKRSQPGTQPATDVPASAVSGAVLAGSAGRLSSNAAFNDGGAAQARLDRQPDLSMCLPVYAQMAVPWGFGHGAAPFSWVIPINPREIEETPEDLS